MTLATLGNESFIQGFDQVERGVALVTESAPLVEFHDELERQQLIAKVNGFDQQANAMQLAKLVVLRRIAELHPAPTPQESGARKGSTPTVDPFPSQTMVNIRAAKDALTDDEFQEMKVQSLADPENHPAPTRTALVEKARQGRRERQQAAEERHAEAAAVPPLQDWQLHISAVADLHQAVEAESVDLIFTDPPYGTGALKNLNCRYLAEFASHALKPGCLMAVLIGQALLPDILAELTYPQRHDGGDMQYLWTIAYDMPGASTMQNRAKAHNNWKPLILLSKGDYNGEWYSDKITIPSRQNQEADLHRWQQQEEGIRLAMSKFLSPGKLVVDPFCGASTTGVAALALGCAYIGADIDPKCIDDSERRLHEQQHGSVKA